MTLPSGSVIDAIRNIPDWVSRRRELEVPPREGGSELVYVVDGEGHQAAAGALRALDELDRPRLCDVPLGRLRHRDVVSGAPQELLVPGSCRLDVGHGEGREDLDDAHRRPPLGS
jgi:hypothetical protein